MHDVYICVYVCLYTAFHTGFFAWGGGGGGGEYTRRPKVLAMSLTPVQDSSSVSFSDTVCFGRTALPCSQLSCGN